METLQLIKKKFQKYKTFLTEMNYAFDKLISMLGNNQGAERYENIHFENLKVNVKNNKNRKIISKNVEKIA